MSGMEMLFKSFGLDPEAMTKTAAEFRQGIEAMNKNMALIIMQNEEILRRLREMKDDNLMQYKVTCVTNNAQDSDSIIL